MQSEGPARRMTNCYTNHVRAGASAVEPGSKRFQGLVTRQRSPRITLHTASGRYRNQSGWKEGEYIPILSWGPQLHSERLSLVTTPAP